MIFKFCNKFILIRFSDLLAEAFQDLQQLRIGAYANGISFAFLFLFSFLVLPTEYILYF